LHKAARDELLQVTAVSAASIERAVRQVAQHSTAVRTLTYSKYLLGVLDIR
jgi:hypothetical protein